MADARYPMMRGRRRRRLRLRLPRVRRGHAIALAVLSAVAIVAAIATLRPAPRVDPSRALADARAAYRLGNYSAARNHALATLAAVPASQPAMLLLARSYVALGDGIAAEGAISRAGDLRVPPPALAGLRAQARFLQGDLQGAIDAAATAPATDGDAIRAAARAVAAQGDGAAATAALDRWIAGHPRDAAAWADLGRVRLNAGEIAAATNAATTAARLAPGDPIPLTLQAEIMRVRFGLAAALPWFEAALQRDAYYHPALIEYAATLGDAGRYAEMLSATRRARAVRRRSTCRR